MHPKQRSKLGMMDPWCNHAIPIHAPENGAPPKSRWMEDDFGWLDLSPCFQLTYIPPGEKKKKHNLCIDFYKHLVHGTLEKSANFSGLLTRLKMHQKIALMGRRWFKSRETSATATSGQELCVEHFAQTSWCYLTGFHPDKSQICYPKKGFNN